MNTNLLVQHHQTKRRYLDEGRCSKFIWSCIARETSLNFQHKHRLLKLSKIRSQRPLLLLFSGKDGGYHYYVAMKLSNIKHWLPSKKYLLKHFRVSIHFSSSHSNYYTTWKCVTNEDEDYKTNPGHPDLRKVAGPLTSQLCISKQSREEKNLSRTVFFCKGSR